MYTFIPPPFFFYLAFMAKLLLTRECALSRINVMSQKAILKKIYIYIHPGHFDTSKCVKLRNSILLQISVGQDCVIPMMIYQQRSDWSESSE